MIKQRHVDWQDTNMSLFGSDIEKACKAAAAQGEPQWRGAGTKVGVQIWRIEQFKVVAWPRQKYGSFHTGDSYIVLLTYVKNPDVNPDKLDWDIHFWIGKESTQDEYGTAAYKTVELDDFLGGAAVQHREVQGSESAGFNKIFNGKIALLDGGVESGFNPPREVKRVAARLYSIKGLNGNLELRQVGLSRASMNSGDVYILDAPDGIFQWNGSESNKDERAKAAEFVRTLASNRSGAETHVLNEADAAKDMLDDNHPFWSHLPRQHKVGCVKWGEIKVGAAAAGGDDKSVHRFEPTLYRISDGVPLLAACTATMLGSVSFSKCASGDKLSVSKLESGNVFVYDTGFEVFLWVGKKASSSEKMSAFPFAQKYLKDYHRPPVLPITRVSEGNEPLRFTSLWSGPEKSCWGKEVGDVRFKAVGFGGGVGFAAGTRF